MDNIIWSSIIQVKFAAFTDLPNQGSTCTSQMTERCLGNVCYCSVIISILMVKTPFLFFLAQFDMKFLCKSLFRLSLKDGFVINPNNVHTGIHYTQLCSLMVAANID